MENIQTILKHFLNITILKIDTDGNIEEVIFNTKEDFKPTKSSNIEDLFSVSDRIRINRLVRSGLNERKRYVQLASKYGVREYADIDMYVENGDIYIALKFFESDRERELMYDRRMEEIAEMAELDPLTGLLNRYGYWERIKYMLSCGDPERRLGIIFLDVDKLKEVNDTMGHKAGDKAISQISNLIADSIRKRDVAVRYGGDEFVIVVEELTGIKSTAVGLGKRLLRYIQKDKKKYLTTVSVGVHTVKVGDFEKYLEDEKKLRKCWDKAVDIADEMAYKAKQDGRNRLVFSGDSKDLDVSVNCS